MKQRHSNHRSAHTESGQLRIIGGQWRGRKLQFPLAEGLRPTGDRIRETLFNWLAPVISGARCLDIFAGSGALGLEALSRGAAHTIMLERATSATTHLRHNCALLQAEHGEVIAADAVQWLQQQAAQPFDVVFIDPPFSQQLWQPTIDALTQKPWLATQAAIYIESGRDTAFSVPASWQLHREKKTGNVCYRLYYNS